MLLRGADSPGYHHAERANLSAHGALTIEGEIWTNDDADDYEWEFHVPADQVPGLVAALGGTAGDDVLALLKAHCEAHERPDWVDLMKQHGVTYTFFSRFGD
jgi:hypothetical protein